MLISAQNWLGLGLADEMGLLDRKTLFFSSLQYRRPPTDGLTHHPLDHMGHTAEHLDPTGPTAASSSAVAGVNAWLDSLAAEAGRGAGWRGGGGGAASELSLGPDSTPRGVAYLRTLAAASQARSRAAGIAAAGLRAQAAEYRAEVARLREALERAGLARDALPSTAAAAAHAVAAVANLLAIRDTDMSR